MERPLIAALDVGGTFIKAALVDSQGKIVRRAHRPTQAQGGPRHVVGRIVETVEGLCQAEGLRVESLRGVGLGCAGPLNPKEGIVYHSPNLPGWSHVPVKAWTEEALGVEVVLENDANAWTLGEHRFGAGQGTLHMVCLTLGTGVGGGIIIDGKLLHGDRGLAAELGHTTINVRGPLCKCGNRGCLEVYASAPAVVRAMRRRLKEGVSSRVEALAQKSPDGLSAKLIAQAARMGDGPAREALAEVGRYLGVGIANIANALNPQMVVIGGAVAGAGRYLLEPARQEARRRAFPGATERLKIVRARLGEDAALLGAATPFLS
jgi:glucokinase